MANSYISTKGIVAEKHNPFLQNLLQSGELKSKNKILKGPKGEVYSNGAGEIFTGAKCFLKETTVDEGLFIKIYASGLKDIFNLSTCAQKAFAALTTIYSKESCGPKKINDMVSFNYRMAQESEWKPSKKVFRSALNELCKKKFLCPVADAPDWFWTNPTIFHRGSRLAMVNLYVAGASSETTDKI